MDGDKILEKKNKELLELCDLYECTYETPVTWEEYELLKDSIETIETEEP